VMLFKMRLELIVGSFGSCTCLIWIVQVEKSNVEGLLQRHVEMSAEIKNLDTDLQMLVYENYNKFISATDTIKR
jgi:hypothetical protein